MSILLLRKTKIIICKRFLKQYKYIDKEVIRYTIGGQEISSDESDEE